MAHCYDTMPASHKARQKPRKAQVIRPGSLAGSRERPFVRGWVTLKPLALSAFVHPTRLSCAVAVTSGRCQAVWKSGARQLQGSLQRRSEAGEQRRDSNAVTTESLARSSVNAESSTVPSPSVWRTRNR